MFRTFVLMGAWLFGAAPGLADAEDDLAQLFADERAFFYATTPGARAPDSPAEFVTRYSKVAEHALLGEMAKNQKFLERLEGIERSALSSESQLNYDMFRYMLDRRLVFAKHKSWRIPILSDSGFHTTPVFGLRSDRFKGVEDYEAYINRLEDLPRFLSEHSNNMRSGMETGWTMPKVVLDGLLPSFDQLADATPEDSPFYAPFKRDLVNVPIEMQDDLRERGLKAVSERVIPAYERLRSFMRHRYYPNARDSLGASELPDGDAYYADMVKFYTTLNVTPDWVHELGLQEVARIRAAMEEIIAELDFEGSFADFVEFLRTDPQFYAQSSKELLMHASYIAKKIDGRLPLLFNKLPRQPYGVEPVPDSIAPNYTTGRYIGASLSGARGGYYWVNTYALDKRPLYVLPSLTLHEGMPGHHLQIALSKELENVPQFRLGLYPHAYGEGWGLYSEKLGEELDIYETPYERFGQLTYEMWRACRLVIDTGIHAKGWTRDQAIKLLEENSALSTHNIRTEVDRYISWPGQALAYKMGELTILRLRTRSEEALGEGFDIRAFHDVVLSMGGVPMTILEARVEAWISDNLAKQ